MATMLIRNATLIDGRGGAPIENAGVLVEGSSIRAAGRLADLPQPENPAEVLDAQGGYILPGFIDTHLHLLLDGIDSAKMTRDPFTYSYFESIDSMRRIVESGVTSVRDAGGADAGVKQAVAKGLVRGPRMQISITVLNTTGGYLDPWMPGAGAAFDLFPPHAGRPSGICDGVDEVRKKVREVIRAGAEVVKLGATGNVFDPANPDFIQFTPAELQVVVEEATLRQKRVMAHLVGTQGIKNAVRAGIHSVEHGFYLDDEAVAMMVERGTYLVPTLMASKLMLDSAEANPALSEEAREAVRNIYRSHSRSIALAYEAGVPIAMGTDEGVMPHGHSLQELGLMCDIGMAPMDIIQSGTRIAAGCLGWQDKVDTVEAGKLADLVITRKDPLADIRSLDDAGNIGFVLQGGQVIKDTLNGL